MIASIFWLLMLVLVFIGFVVGIKLILRAQFIIVLIYITWLVGSKKMKHAELPGFLFNWLKFFVLAVGMILGDLYYLIFFSHLPIAKSLASSLSWLVNP